MSRQTLERALPAGDRILLDTSILIAYLNGGEAISVIAAEVIDRFVRYGRNTALVSMVSAMEVLVRPLRLGPGEGYDHVIDFLGRFPNMRAMSIDLAVAQEAAALRAVHRFSTPDALIAASGLVGQVGHLVTNDRGWRQKLQPLTPRIKVCYLADHLPFP